MDGRKYSVPLFSDFIDGDILDMIDENKIRFYPVINRGVVDNNGRTGGGSSRYIPGLSDYLRWKEAKDEAPDKGILLDAKRFRE